MRRPRPGVGSELLPVALILIGLAGTLGLVVSMHRKAAAPRPADRTPAPAVVATVPPPPPADPEVPAQPPPPVVVQPPPAPVPVEDPTKPALARLKSQEGDQRQAAAEADRKAEALNTARRAALADAQKWRRREALVRGQVDRLDQKAQALETEADSLAMERDVLARERDAAKAAMVKARAKNGGYAVMPNKGANGTWQRPVMIECRDGLAILQPKGISFSMVDLAGTFSARSSPFVLAVGRELIQAHRAETPDGAQVVPYIYFVIRPDGIRPYYEARSKLEPLGMAFGYELVEQDWEIDFPDFDDLANWDDSSTPRRKGPGSGTGNGPGTIAGNGGSRSVDPGSAGLGDGPGRVAGAHGFVWPTDRPGSGSNVGGGPGGFQGLADPRRDSGRTQSGQGVQDTSPGNPTGGLARGDGSGFVWPADRPGGTRGGDGGMWPTQMSGRKPEGVTELPDDFVGNGPSGAGLGSSANASAPGGPLGSGTASFPPLPDLTQSGAGGSTPDPSMTGNGSRRGSNNLGGSGGGGTPGRPPGLVPVNPDGLPGLDSPDQTGGTTGSGVKGSSGSPTLTGTSSGSGSPARTLTGNATGSGSPPNGSGRPPSGTLPAGLANLDPKLAGTPPSGPLNAAPPPGWVRIDPAQLARAVDGDQFDPERPPAPPRNAQQGQGNSGSTNDGSRGSTGQASGSGSSQPQQPGQAGPGVPTLGMDSSKQGDYRPKARSSPAWSPKVTQTIKVPLDLVVACGPKGVVIHPGGYRLTTAALAREGALQRDLQTIVRNHELIDPGIRPVPRVQFLVEPGGSETYELARRKTILNSLDWPVSLSIASGQPSTVFPKERF